MRFVNLSLVMHLIMPSLFANQIFDCVEPLSDFPLMGRAVPELNLEQIREIIHGNYRIIYRLLTNEIEILTVHHSSRLLDISKLFDKQ